MEAKRRADREAAIREAAAAKAAKIERQKQGLADTRAALAAEVRAKTISKEELKRRNLALQVESEAIKRVETGEDEEEKSDDEDIVILGTGTNKRKVSSHDDEDDELDEDDEGEEAVRPKRTKFEETGLLHFEGAVSVSADVVRFFATNIMFVVRSMC